MPLLRIPESKHMSSKLTSSIYYLVFRDRTYFRFPSTQGTVFLLQPPETVKKNFEEFFSPFSVSPVGVAASVPSARALYLATPPPPVNRKNLLPVDFFLGGRSDQNQRRERRFI